MAKPWTGFSAAPLTDAALVAIEQHLAAAPATFKSCDAKDREWAGQKYSIQVAPEDCTGCGICVDVCPAKNKSQARLKAINMVPQPPLRAAERDNWDFFLTLPETDRRLIKISNIRQQQLQQPLFEFSGACSGCGETPYVKLLSQLFGDRLVVVRGYLLTVTNRTDGSATAVMHRVQQP